VKELFVAMNNVLVGIWKHSSSGEERFQYLDTWINSPLSRGLSLSLPVVKGEYKGAIVKNYFSNLLPERKDLVESIQKRYSLKNTRLHQ